MQIKKLRWQQTLAIRQEVIWPNKPLEFCHEKSDENAWHYDVYIEWQLVWVASVYLEISTKTIIAEMEKMHA